MTTTSLKECLLTGRLGGSQPPSREQPLAAFDWLISAPSSRSHYRTSVDSYLHRPHIIWAGKELCFKKFRPGKFSAITTSTPPKIQSPLRAFPIHLEDFSQESAKGHYISHHASLRSFRDKRRVSEKRIYVKKSAKAVFCRRQFFETFVANTRHCSYALFKAKDKKLLDDDDLATRLESAEKINSEYVRNSFLQSQIQHHAQRSNGVTDSSSRR